MTVRLRSDRHPLFGPGFVLLVFDRPVHAPRLDISILNAVTGLYLAPSDPSRTNWVRQRTTFFPAIRAGGPGSNIVRIGPEVTTYIQEGTFVEIMSADGSVQEEFAWEGVLLRSNPAGTENWTSRPEALELGPDGTAGGGNSGQGSTALEDLEQARRSEQAAIRRNRQEQDRIGAEHKSTADFAAEHRARENERKRAEEVAQSELRAREEEARRKEEDDRRHAELSAALARQVEEEAQSRARDAAERELRAREEEARRKQEDDRRHAELAAALSQQLEEEAQKRAKEAEQRALRAQEEEARRKEEDDRRHAELAAALAQQVEEEARRRGQTKENEPIVHTSEDQTRNEDDKPLPTPPDQDDKRRRERRIKILAAVAVLAIGGYELDQSRILCGYFEGLCRSAPNSTRSSDIARPDSIAMPSTAPTVDAKSNNLPAKQEAKAPSQSPSSSPSLDRAGRTAPKEEASSDEVIKNCIRITNTDKNSYLVGSKCSFPVTFRLEWTDYSQKRAWGKGRLAGASDFTTLSSFGDPPTVSALR